VLRRCDALAPSIVLLLRYELYRGTTESCEGLNLARVTLRTERLILRPFREDDVAESLGYRNDDEFARYLPHVPHPFTQADAERFVATNMTEPWDRYPTFAIELDGRLVGTVNLEVEADNRIAMIGYAIGRSYWGKGVASEAARAALAWGFETFGLNRVWASTDARHARSRRVLEKLGMELEGTLRGHAEGRAGERVDVVIYGLFRKEWEAIAMGGQPYTVDTASSCSA
jgi:ribosomal-protein-alanine N-acetyltransferase